jgi:hypothetical protein
MPNHRLSQNVYLTKIRSVLMCTVPCIVAINEEEESTRCYLVFLLHLRKAQQVSGSTTPIIRSSRLYL